MRRFIGFTIVFLCFIFCVSCRNSTDKRRQTPEKQSKQTLFRLVAPQNGATFKNGEILTLNIEKLNDTVKFDSCRLNIDGKYYKSLHSLPQTVEVSGMKMGVRRLLLNIYSGAQTVESLPFAVKIIPASEPQVFKYKIVKEYPHDEKAYTQGLFYSDGFLYEGTGKEGASSLRKVETETGKVLQQHNLDKQYFGEGICLHKGKIHQITWRNREGFIYNYPDFTLEGKFNYNSEGWGITSDGENMWMSDGTSNLYKLNDNMTVIAQLEVYTNKGAVGNLNELEYINGEIWANVYTTDIIVIINPETGEVTGQIDLENILKKELHKPTTDVLNGIAYDQKAKRLFVTGKNWPRLFEIELVR